MLGKSLGKKTDPWYMLFGIYVHHVHHTLGVVIEELKQWIVAIAAKVRRYQERVAMFRQNRTFQNNQRQFYWALNQEGERSDDDQPDSKELKKFWGDMWCELVDHNRDAKWLKDLQSEVRVTKQEKVDITKKNLKKTLVECQVESHQVQT